MLRVRSLRDACICPDVMNDVAGIDFAVDLTFSKQNLGHFRPKLDL